MEKRDAGCWILDDWSVPRESIKKIREHRGRAWTKFGEYRMPNECYKNTKMEEA
ncbi:MAG: hypothetical protein ABSE72_01585 [Bacteroidales bacterium]|jgi:hypothetical protein